MELVNRVKTMIKKNDRLYLIARYVHNRNDPNLLRLIKGYYEETVSYSSILITHNGNEFPDDIAYHIKIYNTVEKVNIKRDAWGLCAALWWTLKELIFCDLFKGGMTPVIEWGNGAPYYDPSMDEVTKNVFEYYFEPVSSIDYRIIMNCRNVIEANKRNATFLMRHVNGYDMDQDEIEELAHIYKKYIHLNETTKGYIESHRMKIMKNSGNILGVHVRGTDYNIRLKDHPLIITTEDYIAKAKELFASGKYESIFLATDDISVKEAFEQEFEGNLLYYTDVFRTENHIGPHSTFSERPLHRYRLGLEVLRDIYTLADCDSLVCSLSGVSFAARYVNLSLDRSFRELVVLDHGINKEDSAEVKKARRIEERRNRASRKGT